MLPCGPELAVNLDDYEQGDLFDLSSVPLKRSACILERMLTSWLHNIPLNSVGGAAQGMESLRRRLLGREEDKMDTRTLELTGARSCRFAGLISYE